MLTEKEKVSSERSLFLAVCVCLCVVCVCVCVCVRACTRARAEYVLCRRVRKQTRNRENEGEREQYKQMKRISRSPSLPSSLPALFLSSPPHSLSLSSLCLSHSLS